MNVLGVLLVCFGALILWISTQPSWKRPSDQIMHTPHTDERGEDNTKVDPQSELSEGTDASSDVRKRNNKSDDQTN